MPFLILDEIAEVAGDIHLEFVKVMSQERMSKHWLVRIIESSVAWFGRRLWRVVHIISLGVVTVNAEEHISEFFFFGEKRIGRGWAVSFLAEAQEVVMGARRSSTNQASSGVVMAFLHARIQEYLSG